MTKCYKKNKLIKHVRISKVILLISKPITVKYRTITFLWISICARSVVAGVSQFLPSREVVGDIFFESNLQQKNFQKLHDLRDMLYIDVD